MLTFTKQDWPPAVEGLGEVKVGTGNANSEANFYFLAVWKKEKVPRKYMAVLRWPKGKSEKCILLTTIAGLALGHSWSHRV